MDLPEKYMEFLDIAPIIGIPQPTWDDFFDYCDIPPSHRTDFAAAAILKQISEKQATVAQ